MMHDTAERYQWPTLLPSGRNWFSSVLFLFYLYSFFRFLSRPIVTEDLFSEKENHQCNPTIMVIRIYRNVSSVHDPASGGFLKP